MKAEHSLIPTDWTAAGTCCSAWIDEMFTMQVSSMDWRLLLREMRLDYAHPPLEILVAKWVTNLIGYGVWQVRLLSGVCGTAEIFAMGLLAAKLFGQRLALLSAAFLAVAQAKIYESQEARAGGFAGHVGELLAVERAGGKACPELVEVCWRKWPDAERAAGGVWWLRRLGLAPLPSGSGSGGAGGERDICLAFRLTRGDR